ncbi:MAG: toprim domain-containing protein [Gammaproteobacteria bacterium]|nr:toprim domain-containing protein [Gammaproteobacteria bacterium]
MSSTAEMIGAFRDAMHGAGLTPPERIEPDGALHRFHVEGDRSGSANGWYLLHLDGRAAGAFGSWKPARGRTGPLTVAANPMPTAEAFAALIAAARARAQAKRRAEHEARAVDARGEWARTVAPDHAHPYLIAKGVQAHNLRQLGAWLIVPLFDAYWLLWNVQRIMPDGTKRFRPGRAGGLFSPIGDLTYPTRLLICEGWATGATLHEETGHPVLCAMNAGNLLRVAQAARTAWPGAGLVICADNDRYTAGNPGVNKATEASKATGAALIVPEFPEGASGTDFNDLAALRRKGRAA